MICSLHPKWHGKNYANDKMTLQTYKKVSLQS